MNKSKRKRGGQPGNRNAVKHGYYSQAFKEADQVDLDMAAGVEGFDEEIALLRFKIKKAMTEDNAADLMPLVKAAGALEKLIRTDFKINGKKSDSIELSRRKVRIMIDTLNGSVLAYPLIKRWCGYVDDENNGNQKTDNPKNEPDFP